MLVTLSLPWLYTFDTWHIIGVSHLVIWAVWTKAWMTCCDNEDASDQGRFGFNLICSLNLFAKKKLQTNQNIGNLIWWFVKFILQTVVSREFVKSYSLQDWFHKHKLTCNTRMCLQHKFDKYRTDCANHYQSNGMK